MGSPQNTASTIRLPTNNPARRSGGGHREPQLNTAHHGRATTVTYPPRTPAHGRHAPAAHGVGHQSYGGHSVGETPGPIPNPEAKTRSADGTAPGRVWESRTPPDHTTRVEPPHHTVRGLPAFNTHYPARALRHRPSSHGEGLCSSLSPAAAGERAGPRGTATAPRTDRCPSQKRGTGRQRIMRAWMRPTMSHSPRG